MATANGAAGGLKAQKNASNRFGVSMPTQPVRGGFLNELGRFSRTFPS